MDSIPVATIHLCCSLGPKPAIPQRWSLSTLLLLRAEKCYNRFSTDRQHRHSMAIRVQARPGWLGGGRAGWLMAGSMARL